MSLPPTFSTPAAATTRARHVAPFLALLVLFLISLPAVTARIYASDEIQWFAFLRSVWFDGDVSFDNEYRYFYDRGVGAAHGFHETFLERTTATGLRENFGTIGSAILWAPFYGLADVTVRVRRVLGGSTAADGFSSPYIAAVCYGSAFYGFVALILSALAARRIAGDGPAAAFAVWIGTPLLFYMYLSPVMAHATGAFAVAAFVLAWLVVREQWSARGIMGLGALAGLMIMVREQDLVIVGGPAADLAWTMWSVRSSPAANGLRPAAVARKLLFGTAAAALVFVPQALTYLALNGRLGPSQLVSRKMVWWSPHAMAVLLSPEHGFLLWTPLAGIAIAGLVWLAAGRGAGGRWHTDHRQIAVCALLMLALEIYIAGAVDSWTVAGAFGQRRFVSVTVLLVLGLSALATGASTRARQAGLAAALALCIWWNVGLTIQFGLGLMDRQRLELARNAYDTFVTVPRLLPATAYRYLFDRQSFYQSRQ
jgi:hypothetical protein